MKFNYKMYFSICDSFFSGIGGIPYESWQNVLADLLYYQETTYAELEEEEGKRLTWELFREALSQAGLVNDSDNPLFEPAEGLVLSMTLEIFITWYFHSQVANSVSEGMTLSDAKASVNEFLDQSDNRWFATPDGTKLYLNPDETVSIKPKKKKKKKKKSS